MSEIVGLGEFMFVWLAEYVFVFVFVFVFVGGRGVSGGDASDAMVAIDGCGAGASDADASDAVCAEGGCPLDTWPCAGRRHAGLTILAASS